MYHERYSPWHRYAPENRQWRQRVRDEQWRVVRYNLCKALLTVIVFIIVYNCLPDWLDDLRSDDFYEKRRIRAEQLLLLQQSQKSTTTPDA